MSGGRLPRVAPIMGDVKTPPRAALPPLALALAGAVWAGTLRAGGEPAERERAPAPPPAAPKHGEPAGLPRPSSVSVAAFEGELFPFLNARRYAELGWAKDKGVRDTGPFLNGKYYGTHPAVRVWYSPEVVRWLEAGRPGELPDGAMLIKEQYQPPAERHAGKTEEQLRASLESWTVMVKDSQGSRDGWFWSNPTPDAAPADNHATGEHPVSGFGHYCTRCHASTESPGVGSPGDIGNEFTFAALRNVEGYAGEPLLFRVDDSWRAAPADAAADDRDPLAEILVDWIAAEAAKAADPDAEAHGSHPGCTSPEACARLDRAPNAAWFERFGELPACEVGECAKLPGVTHDWAPLAVPKRRRAGGGLGDLEPVHGLPRGDRRTLRADDVRAAGAEGDASRAEYGADGRHVSPYGEWRWTPMGLAGRDPIFLAQLETELAILGREFPEKHGALGRDLQDACLRCHGAMGHHAMHDDQGDDARFSLSHHALTAGTDDHIGQGEDRLGALARDGVSCLVCHRMVPRERPAGDERGDLRHYLDTNTTGNAAFGPDGEIYGPFEDDTLRPYAMTHATGLKPRKNAYLSDSRMCGTCHVVSLPNVDMPLNGHGHGGHTDDALAAADSTPSFRDFHHHVEQATYLEWLNSDFQTEFSLPGGETNPLGQSCQQCHMSDTVDGRPTRSRIAAIQDATYPDAENLASHRELTIPVRTGYRRHDFAGLNVFLLELTRQFDDVLGVRRTDFMTGSRRDLPDAIGGMVARAESQTARIAVAATAGEREVTADVRVENLAGHRFPTGVGFRRAFLEVSLVSEDGRVVWISGATDATGTLVGPDGAPLPTEFFEPDGDGGQRFQPHREVIDSMAQAQVYETLLKNHAGRFTTSFVHGCETVKDNRLLPRGWSYAGPSPELDGAYLKATRPGPVASADSDFTAGDGADSTRYVMAVPAGVDPAACRVRARLFYQATPPYFLRNLFTGMNAPADSGFEPGPAVRRLHALCGHLETAGTPIENWKLPVVAAEAGVR